MNRKQTSQAISGMLLIVLGLIFLGDQLSGNGLWTMQKLWPTFLIVLGIGTLISSDGADPRAEDGSGQAVTVGVVTPRRSNGKLGTGLWFIFLGGLFLLHTYRVASIGKTWPLFIVVGGLSMMFSHDSDRSARKREQ